MDTQLTFKVDKCIPSALNVFLVQCSLPHLQSLEVMNRTEKFKKTRCLLGTSSYLDLINLVNVNRPFIKFVLIFIKCNESARAMVVWKMLK